MPDIPETMMAARLYEPGPVKIERVPTPQPAPGEVLIRIAACGVCGSDVHITVEKSQKLRKYPRTPGHEAAGTIALLGDGVSDYAVGDRVSIWPGQVCGECPACEAGDPNLCQSFKVCGYDYDGCYAQYVCIPTACLVPLDDRVNFEQGAILADAVSTPYYALAVRGGLQVGERVAIFGCGGLGIHGVQLAKMLGASQVIAVDVRPGALERAKARGADEVIQADQGSVHKRIREMTNGAGVDLAVELIGVEPAIEEAAQSLALRGRLVLVGIGKCRPRMPRIEPFVAFSQSILGSFGSRVEDLEALVKHAAEGRLDLSASITDRRPLEDLNDCLDALYTKRGDPVRIIIQPNA
jgi:propanol-preferring alcohol dehydrogenase